MAGYPDNVSSNASVTLKQNLDVYSLKEPYDKKGMLQAGATLTIIDTDAENWIRIRFSISSNEQAEAQCKRADLLAVANEPFNDSLSPAIHPDRVKVAFSPQGEALNDVLSELRRAQESVDLAMFVLSNDKLIDALCFLSYERKIPVRILLDEDMKQPSMISVIRRLAAHGISVYFEKNPHGKMHMKCAVIDKTTVITGTSNWTKNSFNQNFEDTVMIKSKDLASRYTAFLDSIVGDFDPYTDDSDLALIEKVKAFPDDAEEKARVFSGHVNSIEDVAAPSVKTFDDVDSVQVYFAPRDQGVLEVLRRIQAVQKELRMAMFFISSATVVDQLKEMKFNTGNISASLIVGGDILTPGSIKSFRELLPSGLEVFYELAKGLMHLKATIIDGRYVITGSSNWSESAQEQNYEDMLFFDSPSMATYYKDYISEIQSFCEKLSPLGATPTYDMATKEKLFKLDQITDQDPFTVQAHADYLSNEEYLPVALRLINEAKQSIVVSLYEIATTKEPQASVESLLTALTDAAKRGVYVYVLLDCPPSPAHPFSKGHSQYIQRLRQAGVDARFCTPGVFLHEKMMVVDDAKVIIGSHNWSNGALTDGYESSVLLILPGQDPRFADYIFDHLATQHMESKESWENEVDLHRNISSVHGNERAALLYQLP